MIVIIRIEEYFFINCADFIFGAPHENTVKKF